MGGGEVGAGLGVMAAQVLAFQVGIGGRVGQLIDLCEQPEVALEPVCPGLVVRSAVRNW